MRVSPGGWVTALALIIVALLMAGCGNSQNGSGVAPSTSTSPSNNFQTENNVC